MKKKKLNKLKLNTSKISNLKAYAVFGGASCESPCQGGTGCCNTGGVGDDDSPPRKYNILLYYFYKLKHEQ